MRSVTSEIQYTDFEYKGHPVRVIDTPGFFDTSMPPEEIQRALSQFGDVAREGITALLVVVKKERLTAENAAVCEFVHCVLGDGALHKYGVMVMTHSSDATAALKQALEALPAENYGNRMLGLVGGRLLSCEARAWRQGRIRDSVLGQVLEMHAQNEGRAADPEMFQWARIKQLEAAKLEARPPSGLIAPCTPQPHAPRSPTPRRARVHAPQPWRDTPRTRAHPLHPAHALGRRSFCPSRARALTSQEEMRPHLERLEARHAAAEEELRRSAQEVSEGREAAHQAQLRSLEAELATMQSAAQHSFLDLGLYRRRAEIEAEIEAKRAAHAQQADEKLRALEAQLASSEAERLEMRRMAVEAFKARQGELKSQEAAARQQLEAGGDFDLLKAAAHAAGMDEMDAKLKRAWEERTRDFGKSVDGACSIQ